MMSASFLQVAEPKAGTVEVPSSAPTSSTSAPASQSPMGGFLSGPGLMLVMFVPLLFFMFRRQKKEADARKSIKPGDRVVSNTGLVGELVEMDERFAKVKIAAGTTVTMLVQSLTPLAADEKKTDDQLKDLKEAKK